MDRNSLRLIRVLASGLFLCVSPAQAGNLGFRTDTFGSQFNAMAEQVGASLRAGASECNRNDQQTECHSIVDNDLVVMSFGGGNAAPAKTVSIVGYYSTDADVENLAAAWMIIIALLSPDVQDAGEFFNTLLHKARGQGAAFKTVSQVEYAVIYTKTGIIELMASAL